ncbi:hemolysin D [Herbaspirillum sp. Sphag1AN]|uniref:HlyD family type I secretion periplasmic adaptor subunit n=1 Tax=unclassified Herbaspirillum TaxID=2624150 RepID=UPI00185D217D|nr:MULTISPECIES: HlyD family type I secretion periplasmic adaptor subunit [unclassified Herbaspirillum]MBB3211655.1 hemolysin D [Herbaspirillum sp. Sphag1AN]MBB3245077.1 hemolysin D [Herbaspirillum sp. Sphag64]
MRRYQAVFKAAWAVRHQLDTQPRQSHELAFLPANLELVETPVHPLPRWTMISIVVLTIIILGIAIFGQLDIVAVAKGKLLPDARVKVIQPAITGVVKRILVSDGQRVKAGQLLMELDPTQAAADADNARSAKISAQLAMVRSQALLDAQKAQKVPLVAMVQGASAEEQQQAQHFADGLYREYQDKYASAQAELAKREAELDNTNKEIAKLQATAPLARQQADNYQALLAEKYVAKNDYLDKEQNALGQEHELTALRSHAHQLSAAIVQQHAEIASITSQFRREQLDLLDKASQQAAQSSNNETKADTRQKLMSLTAPVSGTVQQLVVHTLGGVVTAAQSVMEIVPDDAVEVEVSVENKDIGFVNVGQDAVVKLEAFPYTQYGYLTGKVVSVSNDAVQDKKLGLTFMAHIKLPTNRMHIHDKWVALTPGMEVTAEIKTGKRSVVYYFLDPLMQTSQESMRER